MICLGEIKRYNRCVINVINVCKTFIGRIYMGAGPLILMFVVFIGVNDLLMKSRRLVWENIYN